MTSLEQYIQQELPLTDEEQKRLKEVPFIGVDEKNWGKFAYHVHEQVLQGYEEGEMSLKQMLTVLRSCSLGCNPSFRLNLLGLAAEKALRYEPRSLNARKPPYPRWLRESALNLIEMFREDNPDMPISPNAYSPSPILGQVIEWLQALNICYPKSPPTEKTLYEWYRNRKKELGQSPTKPGPKSKM